MERLKQLDYELVEEKSGIARWERSNEYGDFIALVNSEKIVEVNRHEASTMPPWTFAVVSMDYYTDEPGQLLDGPTRMKTKEEAMERAKEVLVHE